MYTVIMTQFYINNISTNIIGWRNFHSAQCTQYSAIMEARERDEEGGKGPHLFCWYVAFHQNGKRRGRVNSKTSQQIVKAIIMHINKLQLDCEGLCFKRPTVCTCIDPSNCNYANQCSSPSLHHTPTSANQLGQLQI